MEYGPETKSLTKCYRGFTALAGLNMMIPKGSIYGFVGQKRRGKNHADTSYLRVAGADSRELHALRHRKCGQRNSPLPP